MDRKSNGQVVKRTGSQTDRKSNGQYIQFGIAVTGVRRPCERNLLGEHEAAARRSRNAFDPDDASAGARLLRWLGRNAEVRGRRVPKGVYLKAHQRAHHRGAKATQNAALFAQVLPSDLPARRWADGFEATRAHSSRGCAVRRERCRMASRPNGSVTLMGCLMQ